MSLTSNKTVHPVLPKPENQKNGLFENLSLSAIEDKELRKKLRNRQSALAARERKKARMLELERQVLELQESHKRLEHENHFLYSRLNFMKQKCFEAGVNIDDGKEVFLQPLDSVYSQNIDPVVDRVPENHCHLTFHRTPHLTKPNRPNNLHDFQINYSSTNNFPVNHPNQQYFLNNSNCYHKTMAHHEAQPVPNKTDLAQKDNFMDYNPVEFYENQRRSRKEIHSQSSKVEQKAESANQGSKFWKIKEDFCTNLDQKLLLSPNLRPDFTKNSNSKFPKSAHEMSPECPPLPSIGEMLETNVNRSLLTSKSLSHTNFEKGFEIPAVVTEKQNFKRKNEAVQTTFKKSKSFHSLSGMSPLSNQRQPTWSKSVPQEQDRGINENKLHKSEIRPSFEQPSSPPDMKFSNCFSALATSQISTIENMKDFTNSSSKSRPNDHSASDSGLSMDEHLDWVNDSSLFDF